MNGTVEAGGFLPFLPDGLGVLSDARLIVGDALRRKVYRWETAGPDQIADLSDVARSCLSDVIVDSRGGMYVSDVGFDFLNPLVDPVPNGVVVYINAHGDSSVVAGSLFHPNGMLITPDNSTLIVAETLAHRLSAFEIQNDGSLRNRRVWAQFGDEVRPHGICLDRDGAIWVAGAGLWARRVREGGDIDHEVVTERPVFATTLGGPERKHLFMCTSTSCDPVITRRASGATIDIAEVATPGADFCSSKTSKSGLYSLKYQ